jgi:single-stranded-DNA-specific exonuclease
MEKYSIADTHPNEVKDALKPYSELTQLLLFNRGIITVDDAEVFLNPDYERDIHDPFLMFGMEKVVDRILRAIKNEEKIIIYGDYDCDGIPGSVILHDFFKKINYDNFENYIPHRHGEGYGINLNAIEQFALSKTTLVITVDCGITDIEEITRAKELGIDTIITDHHVPLEVLPPAFAILNPKQKNDCYPDDMLCGAGVVWKLVCALLVKIREKKLFDIHNGWEKWLLDMAGLSTISDMVPLLKENRVLAHFGLKVLRKSSRPGLQKLLKKAGTNQAHLSEGDVGFTIAPRINAASRMDHPMKAFHLLSANNEADAGRLSEHLHNINNKRKLLVASIVKEAKKTLLKRETKEVIVIGNPKWQVGVLGIVANNIMDEFGCTVFVWGREGGKHIKGSCRSDGSVDVVGLMKSVQKGFFIDIGGHEFAGGFSVSHDKIHLLENEIIATYKIIKKEDCSKNKKIIDKKMSLDEINWEVYREIEKLSPFGKGNPTPLFLFENIEVFGIKMFGKALNHLRLDFKNSKGGIVSAIGFFMNEKSFQIPIEEGRKINLVATLEKSVFRGAHELRLRIVDII